MVVEGSGEDMGSPTGDDGKLDRRCAEGPVTSATVVRMLKVQEKINKINNYVSTRYLSLYMY
jgi:hypothetical protein